MIPPEAQTGAMTVGCITHYKYRKYEDYKVSGTTAGTNVHEWTHIYTYVSKSKIVHEKGGEHA